MQIGIVGKPNVGKSTFFGAATMAPVEIANYPFTTIEPNKGVAYVRTPCPCKELGVKCTPHNSLCVDGTRMVPVELLDVAGLVPDAWEGKGLGNKFLDDLRQADALINVVDVSGSTDIEGNPVDLETHDPTEDILFLRREIECWMREIIKNGFSKIARQAKMQGSKPEAILAERLQGLKVTEAQIKEALREVPLPDDPTKWDDDLLLRLCGEIRKQSKPMIAAMNKADIAPAGNIDKVRAINDMCVATMAETELALKKAAAAGLVEYTPGDSGFSIKEGAKVSDGQRKALEYMAEKMKANGGTGVQTCIEDAAFKMLDLIAVYPVEDENKYTDHFGRVLPDAFLVPRGSTARDLAYRVHTEPVVRFQDIPHAEQKYVHRSLLPAMLPVGTPKDHDKRRHRPPCNKAEPSRRQGPVPVSAKVKACPASRMDLSSSSRAWPGLVRFRPRQNAGRSFPPTPFPSTAVSEQATSLPGQTLSPLPPGIQNPGGYAPPGLFPCCFFARRHGLA